MLTRRGNLTNVCIVIQNEVKVGVVFNKQK